MVNLYLWLNALLYVGFALWCTLAPGTTAQAVGFTGLTASGQSEFLAVYGGMEFGIGLLFGYFAATRQARNGLVLALCFYGPIVAWRAYSLIRVSGLAPLTLGLAIGEWALFLLALLQWRVVRRRA